MTVGVFSLWDASLLKKTSFKRELDQLKITAKDDVLLFSVLNTIPEKCAQEGVETVATLREQFQNVSKVII